MPKTRAVKANRLLSRQEERTGAGAAAVAQDVE